LVVKELGKEKLKILVRIIKKYCKDCEDKRFRISKKSFPLL
jgi:hypothetical protein